MMKPGIVIYRMPRFFQWICLYGLATFSCWAGGTIHTRIAEHPKTFCNPINVNYRFMKINGGNGIREAADPVVVPYKDKYFLFASKSGGYWHSGDFVNWIYVPIADSVLPIEDYAPAVFVRGEDIYYIGSTHGKAMLYHSREPEKGIWNKVREIWSYWDPAFYVEGDCLYLYYGCSPVTPIHVQVLDLNTFEPRSKVKDCLNSDMGRHGWERPGEYHELNRRPYVEGAWMTKHKGKYYLQYAAPGTEWKSYADGTYVGDSPTGPFRYMDHNPVSYKPAGFMGGAGHGCLFVAGGNYWKAATNSISIRHMFERRISFYPAGFDDDGYLYTNTSLGDYPMFLPSAVGDGDTSCPGWMLLSYRKPVAVSSSLPGYPAEHAVDEESRTSWVATGCGNREWMQVDLVDHVEVHAIQINYDEYGAHQKGSGKGLFQSYRIEASDDGQEWSVVADKSSKKTDTPHDYIEFAIPFKARYIKWSNVDYTISPHVSLRGLRVFGIGAVPLPQEVKHLSVRRNVKDSCKAVVEWEKSSGADGYLVRFGIAPDKLYNSFQVLEGEKLELNCLNADCSYYFKIDAYNSKGISSGNTCVQAAGG